LRSRAGEASDSVLGEELLFLETCHLELLGRCERSPSDQVLKGLLESPVFFQEFRQALLFAHATFSTLHRQPL
jgi:hypothetical protein